MSASVKHTPTPLQLKEPNKLKFSMALIEAGFTAEAVSLFVRAVNSHETFITAAKKLIESEGKIGWLELEKALAIAQAEGK